MKTRTHTLFGIFLILPLYKLFPSLQDYSPFLFGIALAAIGATIPDIDHPSNPGIISYLSKHRGWTHSFFGAVFFTVFFGYLLTYLNFKFSCVITFFIGYISHLALDCLTPTGVNWLWPYIKEKYTLNLIVTGSKIEEFLYNTLLIGIVVEVFYLFFSK